MLYYLFTKDVTRINQSMIKKWKSWIFLYQIPFQKLPSKLSPSAYFLFGLNPEKSSLPIVIGNSENESFLFSQHLLYQATFIVTCVVPKKKLAICDCTPYFGNSCTMQLIKDVFSSFKTVNWKCER